MRNPMRSAARCGWMMLLLVIVVSAGAFAQGNGIKFVPGEILVWVNAGAGTAADVARAADGVGADVARALSMQDVYLLRLRPNNGKQPTPADTTQAIDTLGKNPMFHYVGPNKLYDALDSTPNDPKFGQQWHLPLMNMPKAWDLEKGEATVTVGVIDTGCDINHPDLKDRVVPGHNSSGAGAATDVTDNVGHGTHVCGIAGATTDNATGVAGVTWQKVKIMPLKATDTGAFAQAALIEALQYAQDHGCNVVNMSLGGADASDTPNLSDPFNAKILQMANNGIVFTISAGNSGDSGNPPINPANMASQSDSIICVAACGPSKEHSFYSSARPYTTITAPGGDDPTGADPTRQVLSTLPVAQGSYGAEQGTSMASPACAGVVALLLSVPGVNPASVKSVLTSTADTAGQTNLPNATYGAGVVDAYAALAKVAVFITIAQPQGTGGKAGGGVLNPEPIETLRPTVVINVGQIPPANLSVRVDGNPVTNYQIVNVTLTGKDASGNTVPLRYDVTFDIDLAPGQHTITVSGTSVSGRAASDTRTITITPHQIQSGRSLISIPYYYNPNGDPNNPIQPNQYFGNDFRLARWVPDKQAYAFCTSAGTQDPFACFNPPDVKPHKDGDPTPLYPVGLAYWSDAESAKPVLTRGKAITDQSVIIPLKGNGTGDNRFISWNMVGDPFPFDVPFNALLVDTPTGRISMAQAVLQGYILPNIYSYDGQNGYTFRTLPDGALQAWTGHWLGVTSRTDIALVVPPARSTRAAKPAPAPDVAAGGWSLRLSANVRDLHDTYNFIGAGSRAADGYDLAKVQKPPMVSPYVALGISHDDWGSHSGLYAQDVRSTAGAKTWSVVVSTDQPDSEVVVNWGQTTTMPRNLKLTLKDETSGLAVDMRTRSSYTFNSGSKPVTRRLTITARPSTGSAIRISNLAVRSDSRAAGTSVIGFTLTGDATYEVRVMDAGGRSLGVIATRAAMAGEQRVVWQGRDSSGRSLPSGSYLVQVRAIGTDGDSVRQVLPFMLLR